jgi:hypothetical protein
VERALGAELCEEIEQLHDGRRVEAAGGLVGQEDAGTIGERTRHRHAALCLATVVLIIGKLITWRNRWSPT